MTDFLFLGSKITVDSDCNYEIKRYLLPERKAMTNLDSILKNRDTADKAMAFPVVMYGCVSAKELMLLNCVLEKTLESPLDCKEIKPVNPKGNQS